CLADSNKKDSVFASKQYCFLFVSLTLFYNSNINFSQWQYQLFQKQYWLFSMDMRAYWKNDCTFRAKRLYFSCKKIILFMQKDYTFRVK
ncbi:hypothetical protein, partial [Prevotella brunnea]|uniref:hypothetical protein n=1 Tax=Prevotella brunnea TaxID=2508867 RepID=UPI0019617462